MTPTPGTVDYYRERLAVWYPEDRDTSAVALIQAAMTQPGLSDAERLADVRAVLSAVETLRTLAEFDRNRAR